MPQVDHSTDHHAYRCYRQGPDGFRELSICEPGAPREATPAGGTQSTSELADSLRVWKMPDPRSSTRDQIDRNRIEPQSVNSCEPSPSSLEPTDCGALHLPSLSPRNRLERVPRTPLRAGLDFNEGEYAPPPNHEVDLRMSGPPVPIQDLPTPVQQVLLGDSLAPAPPLLPGTHVCKLSFRSGPGDRRIGPSHLDHESILRQLHCPAESERANELHKPLSFDLWIDVCEH